MSGGEASIPTDVDVGELLDAACDLDPSVAILPQTKVLGWPEDEGREGRAASFPCMPLSVALDTAHDVDALVVQYRSSEPKRMKIAALGRVSIEIVLFILDVDCDLVHGTSTPAPDHWLAGERAKVDLLLEAHPGGIYYATKGGYRVVYRVAPFALASEEDAAAWRAYYLASIAYVRDEFGIDCDPAMAAWGQPAVLPNVPKLRGVRDGGYLGDALDLGVWSFEPTEDELLDHRGRKTSSRKVASTYEGSADVDDPWIARAAAVGLVRAELTRAKYAVECPQARLHTSEGEPSSTVYFRGGGFRCLHGHCEDLRAGDFRRTVEALEIAAVSLEELPGKIDNAIVEASKSGGIVQVPAGGGKSHRLRRAAMVYGKRLPILVPRHDLAEEYREKFRAECNDTEWTDDDGNAGRPYAGKELAHHAAVTRATSSRAACERLDEALEVERYGLSVRSVLCPACPQRKTCEARKEPTGHGDVAPHQMASRFSDVGIAFDEQFGISEQFTITAGDIQLAKRAIASYADNENSALIAPWVRRLEGSAAGGVSFFAESELASAIRYANERFRADAVGGRVRVLRDMPRIDPTLPHGELVRALADLSLEVPKLRKGAARGDVAYRALQALAKVRKAARKGSLLAVRGDVLEVCGLTAMARAFRDARSAIVLSASPLIPALRALRPGLRIERVDVVDPPGLVHRTMITATDTHARALSEDTDRLRWYVGEIVRRHEAGGGGRLLIVVAKTFAELVRSWVDAGRVDVAHYGATSGLDAWKDFDGFATIGECWGNIEAVRREAELLGIDANEHAESIVRAELCQAHGRARDPRRTKPARHWHIGTAWPLGWTAQNTAAEAVPLGRRPRGAAGGAGVLAGLVAGAGGRRKVAAALGISERTLDRYRKGDQTAPAEFIAALRELPARATRSDGLGGAFCFTRVV